MSDAKNKNTKGAGGALTLACLLTFVWLALMAILVAHSQPCPQTAIRPLVWDDWVTCRPAYEIGDFLSGAFAPLAFFWFAVTVFIQSSELRLQREELQLTRAETEETRKAIQAQAEESRKQAEYIGKQTLLLEAAERQRVQREHGEELRALLEQLDDFILHHKDAGAFAPFQNSSGHEGRLFPHLMRDHASSPDRIAQICRTTLKWETNTRSRIKDGGVKFKDPEGLGEVLDIMVKIKKTAAGLSSADTIFLENIGLLPALAVLEDFYLSLPT